MGGRCCRIPTSYPVSQQLHPEFVASSSVDFFYNAGNDDITFELGSGGAVTGMTVFGDGRLEGGGRFAARVAE